MKWLLTTLIAVTAGLLLTVMMAKWTGDDAPLAREDLPWQVTTTAAGQSTVFGITLGATTLAEAVEKLGLRYEPALFRDPNGTLSLEAYYSSVRLGGLSAALVLNLAAEPAQLAAMLSRSGEGSRLPSGGAQFPLSDADWAVARTLPIATLTYVPSVRLDKELTRTRFGPPAEVLPVGETAEQWLYPDRGISVLLREDAKTVLQYVPPPEFERLRPLLISSASKA